MNEEFELITVTISLAATAMNENNVELPQANQLSVESCKACHVT